MHASLQMLECSTDVLLLAVQYNALLLVVLIVVVVVVQRRTGIEPCSQGNSAARGHGARGRRLWASWHLQSSCLKLSRSFLGRVQASSAALLLKHP